MLAPLKLVARPDFVGREVELAMLESYVRSDEARPLAVHGPGGVGKSALLAKFVLEHIEGPRERIPFAYLTFDRAELDPQFPLTLIREAVRQIALQSPGTARGAASLVHEIDGQLVADVSLRAEVSSSRGLGTRDVERSTGDEEYFQSQLAKLVDAAGGHRPYLVVLDTFEVAQRRRRSSLLILSRTLARLRSMIPALRVLVAGRAEAVELTDLQHQIGGLTPSQSRHLLARAVGDLTVADQLVTEVAERVDGNPLSLRLAAELMHREGTDALATSRGRRRFLFGLREEQVQGILYRRILDHIDVSVRPLANPGLVVRRITPEVIAHVLAEPCGLGVITTRRAQELFDVLRDEVSLVTETSPQVLVHRSDVRQEMLPLLVAEDAGRVTEIHERAVTYYAQRSAPDDVVEHLYHRLMLGQPKETLDRHWRPAASAALEAAMPELPASSRVYLANTLPDAEVDPADLARPTRRHGSARRRGRHDGCSTPACPCKALELLADGPTRRRHGDPAVGLLRIEALARRDVATRRSPWPGTPSSGPTGQASCATMSSWRSSPAGSPRMPPTSPLPSTGSRRRARAPTTSGARIASLAAGVGVLRVSGARAARDATPARRLRGQLVVEVATLTERGQDAQSRPRARARRRAGRRRARAARRRGRPPGGEHVDHAGGRAQRAGPSHHRGGRPASELVADPDDLGPQVASSAATGRALADALKEAPDDEYLRGTVKQYWQSEADRPSFDYYDDQGK